MVDCSVLLNKNVEQNALRKRLLPIMEHITCLVDEDIVCNDCFPLAVLYKLCGCSIANFDLQDILRYSE